MICGQGLIVPRSAVRLQGECRALLCNKSAFFADDNLALMIRVAAVRRDANVVLDLPPRLWAPVFDGSGVRAADARPIAPARRSRLSPTTTVHRPASDAQTPLY